jgi:hypothetical protein
MKGAFVHDAVRTPFPENVAAIATLRQDLP